MLVTILPFFLAARVAIDEDPRQDYSPWQRYGSESTYDVLLNMSLSNVVHETDNFCSMISSELKCRPKGSDTLVCRFVNGKIRRPDPEDTRCTNARNFVPINARFINEDPFEIRFNSKGIENLVVSRTIPRWRLDMIRMIVSQLNVGFEVEKGYQRFVAMENSSIGYCEVEINMSRAGYGSRKDTEEEEEDERDLEIVFEPPRPGVIPLDRGILLIHKVRHPKVCPNRKVYFFGNHEDFSGGVNGTYMDMTTSISHMRISENEMESYTETRGVMKTSREPRTMRMYQKISLTLKSVTPARNSWPEIPNPASTNLYAYSPVEHTPESA